MPFHVFISRKSQDAPIAAQIKAVLMRNVGGDQVNVFVSEGIEFGDNWRSQITNELARANWLLLVYTGADKNWSWCSHEVGIYHGIHATEIQAQLQHHDDKSTPPPAELERRVICLHHPDQMPPSTIDDRQTVKMMPVKVRALIKRYYSLVNPDVLSDNPAGLDEATNDILGVFGEAMRSHEFCQQIKITVPRPNKITATELPPETIVSGEPSTFSNVMGFTPLYPEHVTWPDFCKNVSDPGNSAWIMELIQAIALIRDGSIQQPIQALHLNARSRLRFRPVLHHVGRSPRKIECDVLFVQDVGGGHLSDLLPHYAKILLPTMRLAYRMRYDLLDVYSRDKLPARNEAAVDAGVALRVQIGNVLDDILAEARSRSAGAGEQVIDAFSGHSEHEREACDIINLMSRLWPQHARIIWEALGYDPSRREWVKDKKTRLTDEEMKQLGDVLKQVDQMNGVFLRLGTARLVEKATHDFPDNRYSVAKYAGYAKRPSPSDVSELATQDEHPRQPETTAPVPISATRIREKPRRAPPK